MTRLESIVRIAPCLLAIVVDSLGFGMMYPLITAMIGAKTSLFFSAGTSVDTLHFMLGLLYLLYPLAMFFGNLMLGDLSDAIGRKRVIVYCMIGLVVSFSLMALSILLSSILLLCIGRAISGLMAGSTAIAQAAVADISTKETRALNMSMVALTFTVGLVLGPLIGGVFSDRAIMKGASYMLPFIISAFLACIAGIWTKTGLKETFKKIQKIRIEWWKPFTTLYEGLKHPKVSPLLWAFFAMQISFAIYLQSVLIHLKQSFNYSSGLLGAFFAFIGIVFSLTNLVFLPSLVKKFSSYFLTTYFMLIMGAGQILSGISFGVYWVWLMAVVVAFGDMIAYVGMMNNFSDAVDSKKQGWVMGIYGSIVALGFVFGGLTTNLLNLFTSEDLLMLSGLIGVIGSCILFVFRRRFGTSLENTPKRK